MNNEQLVQLIRDVAEVINNSSTVGIQHAVEPLRAEVIPGCHVGAGDLMDHTYEGFRIQLQWYAGQLLSMVDNGQWVGINSWLNCVDKFTTPKEKAQ